MKRKPTRDNAGIQCPQCHGTGKDAHAYVFGACSGCSGRGVIAAKRWRKMLDVQALVKSVYGTAAPR